MKSMHLTSSLPLVLAERDVEKPQPQDGEVLVRICAAGVTPTELAWYPTSHTKSGEQRVGAVPSHEFSGEVAEIGDGVAGLSIGQQVYGMNDWFVHGALAEYCVTPPGWIAPKPRRLSHVEAASVPISAMTARQGLYDRADLQTAERVLVHGGAGAVGAFAIQFARLRGAHIVTTASARDFAFVKSLGAHEVLDYKSEPFERKVSDLDVVFDTVGGETLRRSWGVLSPHGRLITIAAGSEGTEDERTKRAFFIVEPGSEQLIEIGQLLDTGALRPVVSAVLPMSEASDAYTGRVAKKGPGKLVIVVAESATDHQPAGGESLAAE